MSYGGDRDRKEVCSRRWRCVFEVLLLARRVCVSVSSKRRPKHPRQTRQHPHQTTRSNAEMTLECDCACTANAHPKLSGKIPQSATTPKLHTKQRATRAQNSPKCQTVPNGSLSAYGPKRAHKLNKAPQKGL